MAQYPEFWKTIEINLAIDPTAIENIKAVLTLLGYTTMQSVVKLVDKKQIRLLELELINLKKMDPTLLQKYPLLENINFGSGLLSTLTNIASNVKKSFAGIDLDLCSTKVLNDMKEVCPDVSNEHIHVKLVSGEIKCAVACPFCSKKSTLSSYWTQTGQAFRISKFQRHLKEHHVEEAEESNELTESMRDEQEEHARPIRAIKRHRNHTKNVISAPNLKSTQNADEITSLNTEILKKNEELMSLNNELNALRKGKDASVDSNTDLLNEDIRKKDEELMILKNELNELRKEKSASSESNPGLQEVLSENRKLIGQLDESKRKNESLTLQLNNIKNTPNEHEGNEVFY